VVRIGVTLVPRLRAGGLCVAIVQVKDLIEAGVHFGHRASRWNPKMRPYIYGKRNLIHIIDLRETVRGLLRAYRYVAQVVSKGGLVLFVGTKRQAKEVIEREAARCGMPYVSERWLGGTLTNFRTIRSRLNRLKELEAMWLPAGENALKLDMLAYMKSMMNEAGKFELTKSPESAEIRRYSKKMVSQLSRAGLYRRRETFRPLRAESGSPSRGRRRPFRARLCISSSAYRCGREAP